MDTESRYELQLIDCNCNDCIFMVRDAEKFKESIDLHRKWQLYHFEGRRTRLIAKANEYRLKKGDLETWNKLLLQAEKMKFQFNKKTATINFGSCSKLKKEVSFIPNHIQLKTQECFQHRRSNLNQPSTNSAKQ